jgi:hypothetical protein
MFIKQLIIVTISSVLLACAGSDTTSDGHDDEVSGGRTDCILRSSIRGYSVLDESNLVIEGSGRRYYHVVLRRQARGIRSSWAIGFDSPTGRVCAGFSDVVFQDHLNNDSIGILFIRELSPEDHNDLLIQFGKKKPEIEQTPAPRDVEGAEVEELDTAADDESSRN